MFDPTPVRPLLEQALDEGLARMFGGMLSEPVPASLMRLVDRLEAASRGAAGEARAIA